MSVEHTSAHRHSLRVQMKGNVNASLWQSMYKVTSIKILVDHLANTESGFKDDLES